MTAKTGISFNQDSNYFIKVAWQKFPKQIKLSIFLGIFVDFFPRIFVAFANFHLAKF